jgi:hypothetical protein
MHVTSVAVLLKLVFPTLTAEYSNYETSLFKNKLLNYKLKNTITLALKAVPQSPCAILVSVSVNQFSEGKNKDEKCLRMAL